MTTETIVSFAGMVLGPALGSWFGIRYALNGLKDTTRRIEESVGDVRDTVRDTHSALEHHDTDTLRGLADLKQTIIEHAA